MNVYVRETSQILARSGYSVKVFSRHHPDADPELWRSDPKIELIHIPAGDVSLKKDQMPGVLDEFTRLVDASVDGAAESYDVVASHYWLSGVVGRELSDRWGVPHVLCFHTIGQIKLNAYSRSEESQTRIRTEPEIASDADKIVACTEEEGRFIASEFGADYEKIEIVSPGVDTDLFIPNKNCGNGTGEKGGTHRTIVYVGRLVELKGVDLLIESFAILRELIPDARLKIVGGGSDEEWKRVKDLSERCGVDRFIEFLGIQPQIELPCLYSDADVIVSPSYHETYGMAVLEAASCGVPAVAADVDGLRAIVVDGATGYLIAGRSADSYAESMLSILEDSELRGRMSHAARQRALKMNWGRSVIRLADVYQGVADTKKLKSGVT